MATNPSQPIVRVGWSGSRVGLLPRPVFMFIHGMLERIPENERAGIELVTGACVGIDATVAEFGHRLGYPVHTVVPFNRALVDRNWSRWASTVTEMPVGTDYRDRNMDIVRCSNFLNAFPLLPEHHRQSARSGTWQTVRLAKQAGLQVSVFVIKDITPSNGLPS